MYKINEIIADRFLSNMEIAIHYTNGETDTFVLEPVESNGSVLWSAKNDNVELSIRAIGDNNGVVYYIDVVSALPLVQRGVTWNTNIDFADDTLTWFNTFMWWFSPSWLKKGDPFVEKTQHFMFRLNNEHLAVTGLLGDVFRCEATGKNLYLDSGRHTYTELHGPFIAAAIADHPDKAMKNAYAKAKATNAIDICMREEREFPAMFESFGWCTWDAFYHDVTADKIYQKLDEFKEKNIPVKWMLIDDGWCYTNDKKMCSMDVEYQKFPQGLKACIDKIKNEYGVEHVGVWHTISGYWDGVHTGSQLAMDYADSLTEYGEGGKLSPCLDEERAFRFWDDFHGFLASSGVDFVKVDNQSSTNNFVSNVTSPVAGARILHRTLERSVNKHFNGAIINCMGMDMENVLSRPWTALNRNSDDFFPNRENGFANHIHQNLYNSIWHSNIMHCDFDMWWSGKADPIQSGVLRAISGGPVYVSDKIGESNADNIYPICGKNGDICRLDNAAKPTVDCIYRDCSKEDALLKAYNNQGDNIALAVFNIRKNDVTETFKLNVIPILKADCDYIAYEYFTKKYSRVNAQSSITLSLGIEGVSAYSLYPIINDGDDEYALIGERSRYFGTGSKQKTKISVKDLNLD